MGRRNFLRNQKNPIKIKSNFRFAIELLIKGPKIDIIQSSTLLLSSDLEHIHSHTPERMYLVLSKCLSYECVLGCHFCFENLLV